MLNKEHAQEFYMSETAARIRALIESSNDEDTDD